MHFVNYSAITCGIVLIAIGFVGCSSGDNDKAAPAKSATVEKGPVPAQMATPDETPDPAKVSTPTAGSPPAVAETPVAGTSAANGADLYKTKTCIACHGADAKTPIMPSYPKLAGQNEQYVIAQMNDIKSGARSHGQTAAMKGIMHLVSDEEIAAIAKWLAGLE